MEGVAQGPGQGQGVSASGRKQRASALQARKNVQSFQHAENMSIAEMMAQARATASPPSRQRAPRQQARPPPRKRKQASSEEDSELDEEDDEYEAGVVAGRRTANGTPARSTRRQRHPRQQDSDMVDLDEVMGSGDDDEIDYEKLAAAAPKPAGRGGGRGRGGRTPRGGGGGRGRGRPKAAPAPPPPPPDDVLHGCAKCRYLRNGCGACRGKPAFTRSHNRWIPGEGRPQEGVEAAPTFHPTEEEFQDPITYISKIMPEASKYGIACIVPPPGFKPPFALEKGTNGMSMESFRFHVRTQYTSHLCCRKANKDMGTSTRYTTYGCHPGAAETPSAAKAGAGDLTPPDALQDALKGAQPPEAANGAASPAEGGEEPQGEFGHGLLDKKLTLRSFAAYSDWAKSVHFSDPHPEGPPEDFAATRRPKTLPNQFPSGQDPSVEEIEAEFWRIVETPDEVVETLYGQDLDSGHYGSGFPLPEWRRRLLAQHLGKGGAPAQLPPYSTDAEREYAEHSWNINNMPRGKGSVLRYYPSADLITGVMVPWLYVGSALSAFCWHVEDHALCSINYLHMGSPKVWYGVPPHGTKALEEAMRDALPHLFEATPNLLHQLVTALSPKELQKRGVPVYRLEHHPGTFVITMPNSYHSGFNCGFNVAEAVNFGPPGWLPHGYEVIKKYRAAQKAPTLSHDSLLASLVCSVQHWPKAELKEGEMKEEEEGEPIPAAPHPPRSPIDGEIPFSEVPREAVRLAAGDLMLRAQEERSRKDLAAAGGPPLPERRMDLAAPPEAKDPATGVYTNTADVDCTRCKCDLWLSAVVSSAAPDVAVCAEHAQVLVQDLGCPRESLTLLYRYTPEELERMVARAARYVEGVDEAVAAAKGREEQLEKERARITPAGPLYDPNRTGGSRAAGEPGPLPNSSEDEEDTPAPAKSAPAQQRKRPPPQPRAKQDSGEEFVEFDEEGEEEEEEEGEGGEEEDSEDEYRPSRGGSRGSGRGRSAAKRGRGAGGTAVRRTPTGRSAAKPVSPPAGMIPLHPMGTGAPVGGAAVGAVRPMGAVPGALPGMIPGNPRVVTGGMVPPPVMSPTSMAGTAGVAAPGASPRPGMLPQMGQPVVVMTPQGPALVNPAQLAGMQNPQLSAALLAQMQMGVAAAAQQQQSGGAAAGLSPQQKAVQQQQQQAMLLAHLAQQQQAAAAAQFAAQQAAASGGLAAASGQLPLSQPVGLAQVPAVAPVSVNPPAPAVAPPTTATTSALPASTAPALGAPAAQPQPASAPASAPALPMTAPQAGGPLPAAPSPALAVAAQPAAQQTAQPPASTTTSAGAAAPPPPVSAPSPPAGAQGAPESVPSPPPASEPVAAPVESVGPEAVAPAPPTQATQPPPPQEEQPAAFDVADFLS